MTQEDLANAARLQQSQISEIEAAKLNIGIDSVQRIARALGAPPADLIDDSKR